MSEDIEKKDDSIKLKIALLEAETKKHEQIELKIVHYFANGLYAREMHMPAGTLVTGKIHAKDHFCVITKGRVSVASEERTQLIEAPFIYTSKLGTKRALYAHVDSIWVTFHPADTQDLEELERNLIVEHYDQLESKEVKKLCHG